MHTFAQKPKAIQKTASAKTTIPGRVYLGQSPEVSSILHLQRKNGNQAVLQMLQSEDEKNEVGITSKNSSNEIARKGCQPGAVIVTYDKQGKGCTAKVKMNITVQRCVTKCNDKARLAEVGSFGQKACQDFCLKEKAFSYYALPNKNMCSSKTCDPTYGECPERCPILNICTTAPKINQWNCKCNCGLS